MRRTLTASPALAVDHANANDEDMLYELNITPRASIDSQFSSSSPEDIKRSSSPSPSASFPPNPSPSPSPPQANQPTTQTQTHKPSIRLLFSLLPLRQRILLLTPAILSSLTAGGIAPFMTLVVGRAFNAFAQFPLTPSPSPSSPQAQAASDALLKAIGTAALQLLGLAAGSLALGSLTSFLWIWVGEVNVLAVRRSVYDAVMGKEMVWFDAHTGGATEGDAEDGAAVGAGGLMAKFSRETDDVRTASSLAPGMVLQHLTTTLAALALALSRSYSLTLVILSAVPLLTLIQGLSQSLASPLLHHEREETARAATTIERAVSAISTVKAFNAAPYEAARASASFARLQTAARKLNGVWGVTSGMAQFVMMAMFVQGFWFGAKLVREGKVQPGDVMAVFWACLIATSNLQMCVPMMITLAKGKAAMVGLMDLVGDASSPSPSAASSPGATTEPPSTPSRTLRKITPQKCHGELALHSVSFAYPSRPTHLVLSNASLFLPAHEMTFIVGASGSGKSTVAQLLLRMYQPTLGGEGQGQGTVLMDEQDMRYLDEAWVRRHVAGVGQHGAAGVVVLEGRSVWDNVVVALLPPCPSPSSSSSPPSSVSPQAQNQDSTQYSAEQALEYTHSTAPPFLRSKVESACRAALFHDFVRDLPGGYDTLLGGEGVGLSGGQRQRLALARAVLRDPVVLVLDEPTSALDPTSRLLVFSALKAHRSNKTTVVITHDLSQIEAGDFVYVMKAGRVVEGGYRGDLEVASLGEKTEEGNGEDEGDGRGEFRKMLDVQRAMGGFLPETEEPGTPFPGSGGFSPFGFGSQDTQDDDEDDEDDEDTTREHAPQLRPLTWGNWMFEVVADLTGARQSRSRFSVSPSPASAAVTSEVDLEKGYPGRQSQIHGYKKKRPSSIAVPSSPIAEEDEVKSDRKSKLRYSLQFTPSSVATSFTAVERPYTGKKAKGYQMDLEEEEEDVEEMKFEDEKRAVERSGVTARQRGGRKRWDADVELRVRVDSEPNEQESETTDEEDDLALPSFWALQRAVFHTIPQKPLLFFGLLTALLSGAMTPIFSFLLSRLLFEVSTGASNTHVINFFGGLVLGAAALDGVLIGGKYFLMESVGMQWVTRMRGEGLGRVLSQDRAWFDRKGSAPERMAQVLVRDGDDARNMVSVVWAQMCVVGAMLGVGLVWALVRGWQLTLAGFAIAPVFAGVMAVQTRLVARCEVRNKRAREEVARGYFAGVVHVRGIRAMGFEPVFRARFVRAAEEARRTGVRGAFVEGCTYGVASGLIYVAEALLFYVGAVLIARGVYTYLQMVEVLNLVVFSVTIGSQLMAFTERIAKAVQATADLHKLLSLPSTTSESTGTLKPALSGSITLSHVSFSYPSRPTQPVLKDVSLTIKEGECVALVGASGSGKSTVAALVQRLYEPSGGSVRVGVEGGQGEEVDVRDVDVRYLRSKIAVVSQQPNLFDASVAENVRYGGVAALSASSASPSSTSSSTTSNEDEDQPIITDVAIRTAAKHAQVHSFVMGLPQGYDTPLGENAALISGGQAQRLQIARALARPGARVLVLDECTSALDGANQVGVLEAILGARNEDDGEKAQRRTTLMVTHKLQVMQMCDRIVVLHEGGVVEEGTYRELVDRKGVFAQLASGGEWVGE
ncbi:hypothetical protein GALMADRAFT_1152567 [Galerina marginata CBS 339.88]|uniref:P-loop containing nucleoside triphosphate hydrolase protein n=1 Tax=Galerina marginata (strain CBS 339.88) TaxID=685588 RepID=A0A067SFH1_GALM3|nr:hypothetical protein GALMADRAFT_1152567 [Galerina marginata CBS 339.88]